MAGTGARFYHAICAALVIVSSSDAQTTRNDTTDTYLFDGDDTTMDKKLDIRLFTRRHSEEGQKLLVSDPSLLEDSDFDAMIPTKIITHGWLSNEKDDTGGGFLRAALLEIADYNVITVDWSALDSINYLSSRSYVRSIGSYVGRLILQLQDVAGLESSDVHLIGHSLGAHIMGFAGRTAGLAPYGRITALDPAGPLFWNNPDIRLDKSNAGFVDVLHTCTGLLGYSSAIGDVDFYPNGGAYVQPGCGWDIGGACSHCRSYSLLLEALDLPGAFVGTKCDSWKMFKAGLCKGNPTTEFGLGTSKSARGSYFFYTNKKSPYSPNAPSWYHGTGGRGSNLGGKC